MATEYQIGALWIGGSLSYLEQLCLKSFVDAGQHITLYTYEGVTNAPEGVCWPMPIPSCRKPASCGMNELAAPRCIPMYSAITCWPGMTA